MQAHIVVATPLVLGRRRVFGRSLGADNPQRKHESGSLFGGQVIICMMQCALRQKSHVTSRQGIADIYCAAEPD